ncbi:fused MFS/spermidine synthase [bacterium]|nr:fused MFS/spermidine synthase [bacterium]
MVSKKIRTTILAIFLLSGAAGLIYEVIWVKLFGFVFGNTVYAISTVLAAFMAGLSLGSYLIGRWADRIQNPLKLYAVLELLIGLSAMGVYYLSNSSLGIYALLYELCGDHTVFLTVSRFTISFLILLVPTTLMGGTLPVLCDVFIVKLPGLARWLGFLYLVNTFGAVLGVFGAGFVLIPGYGLLKTSLVAVCINLLAGSIAFLLSRSSGQARASEIAEELPSSDAFPPLVSRLIIFSFALSGFCALAIEVIWSRILLLVFGSTTYSFTVMLGIFLCGIAVGGGISGLIVSRVNHKKTMVRLLVTLQSVLGLLVLLGMFVTTYLPYLFLYAIKMIGFSWSSFILIKIFISVLILFPLALLFGATFPVVSRLVIDDLRVLGHKVGLLYAVNSLGSILGSVLAGFIIIPFMGTEAGLRLVAVLLLLMACGLSLVFRHSVLKQGLKAFAVIIPLVVLIVVFFPGWQKEIVSLGVYFNPQLYFDKQGEINLQHSLNKQKLIFYREGISSTASVRDVGTHILYFIDGKVEASTQIDDMRLQRMMGYLPVLFSRDPRSAVNIGLGAGITLGALGTYPLDVLHCVEIEPEIRHVAALFGESNGHIVKHPRLEIKIGDGRNYLLLTKEKYDIITSDPFEPLVGGAANLYTYEHFFNASHRLKPGGCMCQYLPLYQLFPEDYQMVIKTFHQVYPYVLVFYTSIDTILLGYLEEPGFVLEEIEKRMSIPSVAQGLQEIGMPDVASVLSSFITYLTPENTIIPDTIPLNSDTHPLLEYHAPKAHVISTTARNIELLDRVMGLFPGTLIRSTSVSEGLADLFTRSYDLGRLLVRGKKDFLNHQFIEAEKSFRQAYEKVPDNRFARMQLAYSLHKLGSIRLTAGELDKAMVLLLESEALGNANSSVLADLAFCFFASGQRDKAMAYIDRALEQDPHEVKFRVLKGQIYFEQAQYEDALRELTAAIEAGADLIEHGPLRANCYLKLGRIGEAIEAYETIVQKQESPQVLFNLGEAYIFGGRFDEALSSLEKAEQLDPQNVSIKIYLARLFSMQGDQANARKKLAQAKLLNPGFVQSILAQDPALQSLDR